MIHQDKLQLSLDDTQFDCNDTCKCGLRNARCMTTTPLPRFVAIAMADVIPYQRSDAHVSEGLIFVVQASRRNPIVVSLVITSAQGLSQKPTAALD